MLYIFILKFLYPNEYTYIALSPFLFVSRDISLRMSSTRVVTVVGGGVIGLTTALHLKSSHPDIVVKVTAEDFTPNTCSNAAGGVVFPPPDILFHDSALTPEQEERKRWYIDGMNHFRNLFHSEEAGDAGVSLIFGYFLLPFKVPAPAWLLKAVTGFRVVSEEEQGRLRLPFHPTCWFFGTFSVDCDCYLPWLTLKLQNLGVTFNQKRLANLDSALTDCDVVINCSGLGAKRLVPDPGMIPYWGQGKAVDAPWVKLFVKSEPGREENPAQAGKYINIFPRTNDTFLGGIKVRDRVDLKVDPEVRAQISKGTEGILPGLKQSIVLREWAAVRPGRKSVRLEVERSNGKYILHNYGHSGHGINFSWGCAIDANRLFENKVDTDQMYSKL